MDPRGNSVRCLQRHRKRERVTAGVPAGRGGRGGPPFPARPGRVPPAAAPSAGSLRPPPPPPSSAAAAAGKGAEETASLPLPTTHAQHGPTARTSATRVGRAPARPASGAPRAEGRGYGGPEGWQVRPFPGPARLASDRCPPGAALASPPLSAFLFADTPTPTRGAKPRGRCAGWGPRLPAPRTNAPPCCFRVFSQTWLPARCPQCSLHAAPALALPGPQGKACRPPLPFSALPGRLSSSCSALPEGHVGDDCFLRGVQPVSAVILPARLCSEAHPLGARALSFVHLVPFPKVTVSPRVLCHACRIFSFLGWGHCSCL